MPYTREDAEREVGDSKGWAVGLEAGIKKWEQRAGGDVDSYGRFDHCGFCFVADNRGIICHGCPAGSICSLSFDGQGGEEILQSLKNLRGELDPMDCKTCANYKPIEVERPTDHPNRIFAEDLRIGMVIRRHSPSEQRELIVILGKVEAHAVPSLQCLAGLEPWKGDVWLGSAGLQPCMNGKWREDTWCEEVT